MDRLNALFSADEVRGIRLLIVEGKIKVDTFHLFSDADLVTTLQDELASQQGKVNYSYLSRILIPQHTAFLSMCHLNSFIIFQYLTSSSTEL